MNRLRFGDEDQGQRDQRDGNVHPEDRAPRPLRQIATQDRPDRRQPARDTEEDRKRLAAFAQRKRLHHDRQSRREHDRPARALDHTEGDDPRLRETPLRRQPAQR